METPIYSEDYNKLWCMAPSFKVHSVFKVVQRSLGAPISTDMMVLYS